MNIHSRLLRYKESFNGGYEKRNHMRKMNNVFKQSIFFVFIDSIPQTYSLLSI
jgi:hypothetical protein